MSDDQEEQEWRKRLRAHDRKVLVATVVMLGVASQRWSLSFAWP
jgi:hypothetical protein